VSELEKKNLLEVGDFGREEVAVLVTDLFGSAGKADDGPIVDGGPAGGAIEEC
jgi:hypothetical protein